MKNIEKFKVTLMPDTIQSSYGKLRDIELDVDIMTFNDGSKRVVLTNFSATNNEHRYVKIQAFIESMDDLMVVSQIKEIITRLSKVKKKFSLHIISTAYTRYDRPMFKSGLDGFGAKCFADFINSLGFESVSFLDCHSDVMINQLKNGFINPPPQLTYVAKTVGASIVDFNFVAPDKGAVKKNTEADVVCDKVRNPETGEITGMAIIEDNPCDLNAPFLVIDDICEGGRTFIEVAKLLEEKYPDNERELYITHGIFSNNAVGKLLEKYSKIHVYIMKKSMYDSLNELDKSKLNVNFLVNS